MQVDQLFNRQFLVFILGGVCSAIVDIGVMELILFFQGAAFLAVTVGFFAGLFFNYQFHANFTFRSNSALPVLLRFCFVVGMNYVITLVLIYLSLSHLAGGVLPGKIASLPIVAVNGYLMSKYWVFK